MVTFRGDKNEAMRCPSNINDALSIRT